MPVLQSCVIAGRSLAVLELAEALLCWGCRILLVVPRVQLSTPGVAREDVHSELVGESFLSTNRLTLLLHPLPHRASGASVGDFPSSSRVVEEVEEVVEGASPVAAWKAMLLLRSTATVAT